MNLAKSIQSLIVCDSLTEEHRQVEVLLKSLESYLEQIGPECALSWEIRLHIQELLQKIAREVDIHFVCEEQGLFPYLSQYHPMVLMEVEHEDLLKLRQELIEAFYESGLNPERIPAFIALSLQFIHELRDHIGREDYGIFPLAERDLQEREKEHVMKKMETLRQHTSQGASISIVRAPKTYQLYKLNLEEPMVQPVQNKTALAAMDTVIKQVSLQKGARLDPHWSPHRVAVTCLSGLAKIEMNDHEEILHPGEGLMMAPRLLHGIKALEDTRLMAMLHPVPSLPYRA
jgi:hemerythrin-like domain-containing protein/quercetin dioxygenase-like cupin family protein